ncbi:MAG TPA: hypothetical protein VFC46_09025 [Humisphaera sp.]|nr:hypothetical protein [Humisphaera sp.]
MDKSLNERQTDAAAGKPAAAPLALGYESGRDRVARKPLSDAVVALLFIVGGIIGGFPVPIAYTIFSLNAFYGHHDLADKITMAVFLSAFVIAWLFLLVRSKTESDWGIVKRQLVDGFLFGGVMAGVLVGIWVLKS